MYGLDSTLLLQAERVKLDGFYACCLRKLLGIAPSYISRVTNAYVLWRFGAKPLSQQLLARQLLYYGRLVSQEDDSLVRAISLEPGSARPRCWNTRRCVGRPRLRWTTCVYAQALAVANGSENRLGQLLRSPHQGAWKSAVQHTLLR